jgi:hypothetical protein
LAGHPSLQEVLGRCEDDFRCLKIFLLKRFIIVNGVTASPPQNCKELLYIKVDKSVMIAVPNHKRHKSPFKLSKSIYVFTSRLVIVNVQIYSRKTVFKAVNDVCKNDINKGEQQVLLYRVARFNENGCLQPCGGDALIWPNVMVPISK